MSRKTQIILGIVTLLALSMGWRWIPHARTAAGDSEEETPGAVIAAVARVKRGSIENDLTIAGAFKPFQDVDVHAKVAGYIRRIYVDVGDHVKDGQTLAVLEVPELAAELAGATATVRRSEQEIHRAEGDVERAKSTHAAAHAMYERLKQAAEQQAGLVAQQEVDNAQARDLESEAAVSSAQAASSAAQQALEVARAEQNQFSALSNYTRIVAPFTGVVTARYADTGALLAAGTSNSQSMPVVRLAEVSRLRLVLPIPESMAGQIHLGDAVKVHVQALNLDIVGKVSRFAGSLDSQTRTMETEIDFDNRKGKLLPGMYAETVLQLAERHDALLVPIEALAQSNGDATILALNSQNNVVEERHVKVGLQGRTRAEVLSGLQENDQVVIGNRSQFRPGEKVVPKEVKLPDADKGGAR